MMMKMNTEKMSAGNNQEKIIRIFSKIIIIALTIYLLSSFFYYFVIKPNLSVIGSWQDSPFIVFLVKWVYALVLLFSVTQIPKNPYIYYKWLNTVSFGILYLWIIGVSFFYDDVFGLLEISALAIIIFINSVSFKRKYHICSNFLYFVLFMLIRPLIWTAGLCYILIKFY